MFGDNIVSISINELRSMMVDHGVIVGLAWSAKGRAMSHGIMGYQKSLLIWGW